MKREFFLTLTTMKKLITTSILAAMVAFGTTVIAQDYPDEYLGLPGDNLNLYATMKLFQESETLEGFERSLNDEKTRVNNLDLNNDNMIDYITVSDYVDGDVHTIVLRAMLDRNETQDVAVFTVQKFANGAVNIQLIGDEDLYGKNYIIEPIYDETPNPGYNGNRNTNVTVIRTTPYEIATWPLIRFIYVPNYIVWRSSWYWDYYPSYWNPWHPYYWDFYYGYHYHWYHHYYSHYHHYDHFRYTRYNDFYYHSVRAYSPRVRVNISEGRYKTTYSHPEQRKEGEALYTKVNPGQPRRAESTSQNRQGGRSDSQASRTQTTSRTSNGNTRQSTETVKGRTENRSQVTKSNQGQRTNDATRNTPPAYGRTNTRPSQSQGTEAARTSRQSAPKTTTSRPSQSKGIETERTSRQSAPKVSTSRSSQSQGAQAAKSSRQSSPRATPSQSKTRTESKSGSSSEKRSSKESKSNSSSKSR
jgi:hypothetical protein